MNTNQSEAKYTQTALRYPEVVTLIDKMSTEDVELFKIAVRAKGINARIKAIKKMSPEGLAAANDALMSFFALKHGRGEPSGARW